MKNIVNLSLEQLIFYGFAGLGIVAASMVIFSKNSVRAVLFLVLTFFCSAGLWMLLEAEFLSVTLVLVYVGAVMVLFLFVVMMLDVELASSREGFARFLPLGLCVSLFVILSLVYVVGPANFGLKTVENPLPKTIDYSNVQVLGTLLYTRFLYPFLLAGILLLVAIIAAISLTFRGRRESKAPLPSTQIEARKEDRLRLISKAEWGKHA